MIQRASSIRIYEIDASKAFLSFASYRGAEDLRFAVRITSEAPSWSVTFFESHAGYIEICDGDISTLSLVNRGCVWHMLRRYPERILTLVDVLGTEFAQP